MYAEMLPATHSSRCEIYIYVKIKFDYSENMRLWLHTNTIYWFQQC